MTRGDIHNRKQTYKRLKNQITTNPDISERDKNILIEGSSDFPSFCSYMENEGLSQSRITRYLRTWKRLLERVEWQIEEVDKTKITEYVGRLNKDEITRADGEAFHSWVGGGDRKGGRSAVL